MEPGAVDFRTEYKVSAGLLPGREPSGEITILDGSLDLGQGAL